jgi:phosphoglycolate phosphatase-like HAD superfamily hydrolase
MLCSNCNNMVRPVVAVDIDGTLGDYHGHFLRFALSYFGLDNDQLFTMSMYRNMYNGVEPFRTYCQHWFACTAEEYRAAKLAYRQGGMKRSMPIFNGAKALCRNINSWGAELWVTTTRPYLSLDTIVPDTVEWLDRHKIAYHGMLFDEDKYAQLSERVDPERVVLVLDDLREMCEAAASEFGEGVPVLAANPYNEAVKWPVIANVSNAWPIAHERLEEWRHQHAD